MKRDQNVMLRLTVAEHELLLGAKPAGEDKASFARRILLSSLSGPDGTDPMLRRAAAFVVAALSESIGFEEALSLFDDHVSARREEVTDGCRQ
jgi:hypothetical protein